MLDRKKTTVLFWLSAALSFAWLFLFSCSFVKHVAYPIAPSRVLTVNRGVLVYSLGYGLQGVSVGPVNNIICTTLDVFRPLVSFKYGIFTFSMPLWMPAVPFGITAWALRRIQSRNRPQPGRCRQCGYNLFGSSSGICPECGSPIPKETQEELTADPPKQ